MEIEYKKEPTEIKETDILPETQQVVITLTTQREIDQLYAMLNFVPIMEALDTAEGADDWRSLKGFLQPRNYPFWHKRLSNRYSGT